LQNTAHLKFNPTGLDKQYKVQHYSNGQLLIQYNVAVKLSGRKKHYILQLNRTDVESGGIITMHLSWQSNADKYCIRWNVLLVNTPKITAVYNHKEIVSRWLKESVAIKQYYTGETADDYILQTEQTLLQQDKLLQVLHDDLFLKNILPRQAVTPGIARLYSIGLFIRSMYQLCLLLQMLTVHMCTVKHTLVHRADK